MRERGLTLVEVLVAMGVAGVAGALLLVIIVNSAGMFSKQSSKVQAGLNINDALSIVRSSIKQATTVAATSSASQLVLKVVSIDASGNIIDNTYDYFVFFLNQNILYFKVFPDALSSRKTVDRIFSTSADNLSFQYFNSANPPVEVTPASATKVRISLTLNQTNIATSEANLRND